MQSPVRHPEMLRGIQRSGAVDSALWQHLASSSDQNVSEERMQPLTLAIEAPGFRWRQPDPGWRERPGSAGELDDAAGAVGDDGEDDGAGGEVGDSGVGEQNRKGGGDDEGIDLDVVGGEDPAGFCLLYTSPSPRDRQKSRMPSSA